MGNLGTVAASTDPRPRRCTALVRSCAADPQRRGRGPARTGRARYPAGPRPQGGTTVPGLSQQLPAGPGHKCRSGRGADPPVGLAAATGRFGQIVTLDGSTPLRGAGRPARQGPGPVPRPREVDAMLNGDSGYSVADRPPAPRGWAR